ncbi:MAG: hypothetical protein IE909_13565 [Campylobacterales bacterium]|nr:hypothetical protein [Campylobacterales bacterium]
MKKLRVEIASPPDREELVAEIWNGNQMIAEINQESGDLELEVYTTENSVLFDYESFLIALIEAKEKLKS